MSRPLLLGHRGARATRAIPENTLASFDLALAHGCDGFEFDVRRTADGRALICHDPQMHDVEIAHAGPGDLAELPDLDQVLARYHASAFLDIELKVTGLEHALLQSLRSHPPQRGYVVSSFLPEVLLILRKLDDHLPLGLLCETPPQLATWPRLPAEYVLPHYTLMDVDVCEALRKDGRKVITWTVNRMASMQDFRKMGVDGIISDDTEMLAKLRG
jgi:glycerophosphoryl diester phosphodiesterase